MLEQLKQFGQPHQKKLILDPIKDAKEAKFLNAGAESEVSLHRIKAMNISKVFHGTAYTSAESQVSADLVILRPISRRRIKTSTKEVLNALAQDKNIYSDKLTWPVMLEESGTQFFLAAEEGDLHEYINNNRARLRIEQLAIIAEKLSLLIKELHQNGFAHRDVKLENFLVFRTTGGSLFIKFCDLGTIEKVDNNGRLLSSNEEIDIMLTPSYRPPEVNQDNYFEVNLKKADCYSLGMVLKKIHALLQENERLKFNGFAELINGLVDTNAQQRLNIQEAHNFFIGNDLLLIKKLPEDKNLDRFKNTSIVVQEPSLQIVQVKNGIFHTILKAEELVSLKGYVDMLPTRVSDKPFDLKLIMTTAQLQDLNAAIILKGGCPINNAWSTKEMIKNICAWALEIHQLIFLKKEEKQSLTTDITRKFLETHYREIPFLPSLDDLSCLIFSLVNDHQTKGIKITEEEVELRLRPQEYIDGQYLDSKNFRLEDPSLLIRSGRNKEIYYQLLSFRKGLKSCFNLLRGESGFYFKTENISATFRGLNKHRVALIQLIESAIREQPEIIEIFPGSIHSILDNLKNNILSREYPTISKIFKDFVELDGAIITSLEEKEQKSTEKQFQERSEDLFFLIQAEREIAKKERRSDVGLQQLQQFLIPASVNLPQIPDFPQKIVTSQFWPKLLLGLECLGLVIGGTFVLGNFIELPIVSLDILGLYLGIGLLGSAVIMLGVTLARTNGTNKAAEQLYKQQLLDYNVKYTNYKELISKQKDRINYSEYLKTQATELSEAQVRWRKQELALKKSQARMGSLYYVKPDDEKQGAVISDCEALHTSNLNILI